MRPGDVLCWFSIEDRSILCVSSFAYGQHHLSANDGANRLGGNRLTADGRRLERDFTGDGLERGE